MKIKNRKDLRTSYELLHMYKKIYGSELHGDLKINVNKLKVAIRNYNKMPAFGRLVRYSYTDGFVCVIDMPKYFDNLDESEVKKHFEENHIAPRPNLMYDCTGQAFTSWFKVVRRGGRWVVYHSIKFDY